ncbi:phosphoribosylglycinamide formyltransferase [Afipia sp. P52-10]|jgi:phosphoribosylglycinamide formyltransferase-1|uniref:phosphoribosylglycinamide formyltransferase n=1 Tax=Afipia sp. P52-10 TaxID=1429916 RepID=UPI0003DF11C8|nr:phosphoribosylglycinamide formyltransferase [Afipia sp. P52-10]ETR74925.1 phosphoribosylglycinamide formyltransferase [Afipia sp. P52-10]
MRRRVAILISGRGSNMSALIEAARDNAFPAEITVVISNKPDAAGVAKAREAGIPVEIVASKPYGKDRAGFEAALQAVLDSRSIDIVCLAGFMRLFTADFVLRWQGRMLNIHPSLLPSFPGLEPHAQAIKAGVKLSGATVHFVTPDTDAGPIIMQGAVAVADDDTPETLSGRILTVEHRIYPAALKLVADMRVRIDGDRCIIEGSEASGTPLIAPSA